MAQWRIKEISDLTKISVRMLHHYDKIGLLKPSVRASNNYRWYSEQDLATLQQIITLKFFGFGLKQIKAMLQYKLSILEQLLVQQHMLKDQAEHLRQIQNALNVVLERCKASGSLDWNDLIVLIERYRMMEELKKTWFGKLNESQQTQYLALKQEFPKEFEAWQKAIKSINSMTLGDPAGAAGEHTVKIFLDIARKMKTSTNRLLTLNADILRSIKEGKLSEFPLSPEGNLWLAKASLAYLLKRWESLYQDIIKNLNTDPKGVTGKKIAKAWRELIEEQFTGVSAELMIGTMIWQEVGRQNAELKEQKTPPSAQEMVKKIHVSLFFNPEAMSWIEQALGEH